MKNITLKSRIRKHLGLSGFNRYPVKVIRGNSPPMLAGMPWHYETKGGQIIDYPSSYSKKGWSNMLYIHSTQRVEVGEDWLLENNDI